MTRLTPRPPVLLLLLLTTLVILIVNLGTPLGAQNGPEEDTLDNTESFALVGDFPGAQLATIALGDFDGDGALDLALGQLDSASGVISYLPGPLPEFEADQAVDDLAELSMDGADESAIGFRGVAGDLDGDGFDENIWVNDLGPMIELHEGSATFFSDDGVLPPIGRISLVGSPNIFALGAGDLSGDGFVDIAYNDLDANEIVVLVGPFSRGEDGVWLEADRFSVAFTSVDGALTIGDVTGDGQPDLIFVASEDEDDEAVTVRSGPIASSQELAAAPSLRIAMPDRAVGALAVGDVDLDGAPDLIVAASNFVTSREEFALLPGPLPVGVEDASFDDLATEIYTAGEVAESLADRAAVGDVTGDGVPDLLLGFADPNDAEDLGRVSILSGADRAPELTDVDPDVARAGDPLTLSGNGFFGGDDLTVSLTPSNGLASAQIGGATGLPLTALSLGSAEFVLPDPFTPGDYDVTVNTPAGSATLLDALTVVPGTRVVELAPGFNLVGWTGDTAIEDALATVDGSFAGVFVWDPVAEVFRSFSPGAPAFVNDLQELLLGDGLWINVDDPNGATWTQPAFADARSVDLVPGLQIAIWTGPDGTPIEEGLAGLPAPVIQILTWDVASQTFRTFNPVLPAALNTLQVLNHGDAFWIEVAQGVTWEQPAAGVG